MVLNSSDKRATALAELREREDRDPFRILIGTILSQRTRDENTTRAVDNLFQQYKNPAELAAANEDQVRPLIRPAGFYRAKAKSIIEVSRRIVSEYDGKVPNNFEELISLPSVGRKTANCVLVYGFGKPAIPVDTHVHRISNRLGIVNTKTPEQTELDLMKKVPKKYWLQLNELFVRFGQTVCKPIGPKCDICSLRPVCDYYQNVISKQKKDS
jgi:endonuclease-3